MARPTGGSLTGNGFTQGTNPTTKYTKAQGSSASAVVDVGNNNASTGRGAIEQVTPATLISQADFATALATLVTNGCIAGNPANSVDTGRGLVYFGVTI
jgi:hypothetical protein